MNLSIEHIILKGLITDFNYVGKVIPFIEVEYFGNEADRKVFSVIKNFIDKYNLCPTTDAIIIELAQPQDISEVLQSYIDIVISNISNSTEKLPDLEWMVDSTEKFCQDKALYNAIMNSITLMDDKKGNVGMIPDLLRDALAVSFDTEIGIDYLEDAEKRHEYLHNAENKLEFDIELLNTSTNGGFTKKTLNMFLAGTHVGKSLTMCHLAAAYLTQGLNVLYITLEMAEEEIACRIDANLFNMPLDDLMSLPEAQYKQRVDRIKSKTNGRLFVKQFPTGVGNSSHFRHLIREISLKKNFTPDVVIIDYINICSSSRMGMSDGNSYFYVKAIAEELRGMAIEENVCVISATQTNRGGQGSSDVDMQDVAESAAISMTVDYMVALIRTEDLDNQGAIYIKQLKNRYSDLSNNPRFLVGIDKPKMRLSDFDINKLSNAGQGSTSPAGNLTASLALPSIVPGSTKRQQMSGFSF